MRAPRSCPSRPTLATRTRIGRVNGLLMLRNWLALKLRRNNEPAEIAFSPINNIFIPYAPVTETEKDTACSIGRHYLFYGFRRALRAGASDQLRRAACGAA